MKRMYDIILFLLSLMILSGNDVLAQENGSKRAILAVEPYNGDTIPVVHLPNVYIYQPPQFTSRRRERFYWRTVRDVKRTLPIAREVRGIVDDAHKHLLTLPDEKEQKAYLNATEKRLLKEYTPQMKKLTFNQGKMLIKLIDRECQQTGYELIKVFMGRFKANFYQAFASIFGASLKKEYDPELTDAEIEEIIYWIDCGAL